MFSDKLKGEPKPVVQVHVVPQGAVLTDELFKKVVATVEYHLMEGTTTIVCGLKLTNGFSVTGQSGSLPTTQFNPQTGMQAAMNDARSKLCELLALMVYDAVSPAQFRVSAAVQSAVEGLKGDNHV